MNKNSSTAYWVTVAILLVVLAIGVALYQSATSETVVTQPFATTTVSTTTKTTATSTATTTKETPSAGGTKAPVASGPIMKADDWMFFRTAGYCTKVDAHNELQGFKATTYAKVTITAKQEAWKCRDGNYYTP